WQPHDANGLRLAMQRRGGLGGLLAAGFVVVLEDQDVTAGERVDAVVSPVAARDRGRAVIEGSDAIRVLLAFANEDTCVWVLQQVRQAVNDAAAILHAPNPPVFAIRSPLAEALRLKPADLVEQRALVVGVVVCRDDIAFRSSVAGRLCGGKFLDIERRFLFAVRFERLDACFAADVILARNRVVARERVNNEAVWRARIRLDGEAAVPCRVAGARCKHLAAAHFAAERASESLQAKGATDISGHVTAPSRKARAATVGNGDPRVRHQYGISSDISAAFCSCRAPSGSAAVSSS